MNAEKKKSYTRRITTANKTQMITILYEITLEYIDEAIHSIDQNKNQAFGDSIRKAQNCIDELILSTNTEYELGVNFKRIYFFEKRQLLKAYAKKDVQYLIQAKGIFEKFHASYLELEKHDKSGPIMVNTQEVYAGMTYGKYSLLENMTFNQNRGYMA
jgi:flagellar protein FliS